MQTEPSPAAILQAVRAALSHVVAPLASTYEAQMTLAITDQLLAAVAARTEHEARWIADEIDAVRALGLRSADQRVVEATGVLSAADPDDSSRRYQLASEVLSRCLETDDDHVRSDAVALLGIRLGRELELTGAIALAGRSGVVDRG